MLLTSLTLVALRISALAAELQSAQQAIAELQTKIAGTVFAL